MIRKDSIFGVFSVRSVYNVAHRVLRREEIVRERSDKVWRWIWTAKGGPKDEVLYVETNTKNCPNKKNRLQEKGIQTDIQCAVCGNQSESTKHVFFNYELSRGVW